MKKLLIRFFYSSAIFFSLIALGTIFQVIASRISENLTIERSKEYVYSITGYILPNTADLICSQRYWSEGTEAMTICSVFKLPEREFVELMNFEFLRGDEYAVGAVLADKGCNEFQHLQDNEEVFQDHLQEGSHLRGHIIQVDDLKKIVMFEMYLHD